MFKKQCFHFEGVGLYGIIYLRDILECFQVRYKNLLDISEEVERSYLKFFISKSILARLPKSLPKLMVQFLFSIS